MHDYPRLLPSRKMYTNEANTNDVLLHSIKNCESLRGAKVTEVDLKDHQRRPQFCPRCEHHLPTSIFDLVTLDEASRYYHRHLLKDTTRVGTHRQIMYLKDIVAGKAPYDMPGWRGTYNLGLYWPSEEGQAADKHMLQVLKERLQELEWRTQGKDWERDLLEEIKNQTQDQDDHPYLVIRYVKRSYRKNPNLVRVSNEGVSTYLVQGGQTHGDRSWRVVPRWLAQWLVEDTIDEYHKRGNYHVHRVLEDDVKTLETAALLLSPDEDGALQDVHGAMVAARHLHQHS